MNYLEAVAELGKRKSLIREFWKDAEGNFDKYLVFMLGMQNIWQISIRPTPNAGNWLASVDDYQANDWIVLE